MKRLLLLIFRNRQYFEGRKISLIHNWQRLEIKQALNYHEN